MLIIAGALYVGPADRASYLAGCVSVVEQARETEGCLDFVIAADPVAADRINVYERWETEAALEAFRGAGPDESQTVALRDADVKRYHISGVSAA